MSPARATSSAVERWIPYEGEGGGGERERRKGEKKEERKEGGVKKGGGEGRGRKEYHSHEFFVYQCHKARVTFGSCFPFPVRTKRGRENGGWLSERLDVDLLLSVSSLLTGSPILGSKVNKTQSSYSLC